MGKKFLIVDQNGTGDYYYIQDAIDAVCKENQGVMILIKEGAYYEKLVVNKPNVTLVGDPGKNVSIIFDDCKNVNESHYKAATVCVLANDFSAENLIFVNSAALEEEGDQTVAVYISADRTQFHHCGFLGLRDTVVTAPRPFQIVERNLVQTHANLSRQYFRCCYFEGDQNIFLGTSTAVFEYCKIHSLNQLANRASCMALSATAPGNNFGYVFRHCIFTGEGTATVTYLSRSLKNAPKIALLECQLGSHLQFEETGTGQHCCEVMDYQSQTENSLNTSAIRPLTEAEAFMYTLEYVFTDAGWCIGTSEYQATKSSRAS